MLDKQNTEDVLNDYGNAIVKNAKINIGDTNRKRVSKITGKTRRGKIDFTGELRDSLYHELKVFKNSFGFVINGSDYAVDLDKGNKRKTTLAQTLRWVTKKPARLRMKNGRFIEMTPSRQINFAKFIKWKTETIGSDRTNFLTDAIKDASKKYEKELFDALYTDVEQSTAAILRGLDNGNNNN